ncbi:MAG: penicillin-binding protein 2 [Verrucomicrobiota bacterium]
MNLQKRIRLYLFSLVVLAGLGALLTRLYSVQIEQHSDFVDRIPAKSEVTVRIPGARGEIKDRNGITLVDNEVSYQVLFNLKEIREDYTKKISKDVPKTSYTVATASGPQKRSETDIVAVVNELVVPRLAEYGLDRPFNAEDMQLHWRDNEGLIPYAYADELSFEEFATFAEHSLDFPGVSVSIKGKRNYIYDSLACHILGFVRLADIKRVPSNERRAYTYYVPDDYGGDGIEKTRDNDLRGVPGRRVFAKNEKGRIAEEITSKYIEPQRGSDVHLTIDARIQFIAERALRDANQGSGIGRGAAVVIDPNDGSILAMASVPSFNPNKFIPKIDPDDWDKYRLNEVRPLINRAIKDFAPGSTFKIPVSFAGFLDGSYRRPFSCYGSVTYGNTSMACWIGAKGGSHGSLFLRDAIMRSCNCYYYNFGNATGINNVIKATDLFSLGEKTGIPLLEEDSGRVPTPKWHRMTEGWGWGDAQTALVSIGQGATEATPLQMASVSATVASGGVNYQPRLVQRTIDAAGNTTEFTPKIRHNLVEAGIDKGMVDIVRSGMYDVVNTAGGTARRAQSQLAKLSGKTGTAQFFRSGEPDNHAWFISFAPFDSPRLAVCVFVQGGKAGGVVAAPVAKKIIEESLLMWDSEEFEIELAAVDETEGNFDFLEYVSFDPTIPDELLAAAADEDDGSAVAARQSIPVQVARTVTPTIAKRPDARGSSSSGSVNRRRASRFRGIFGRR